MYFYIYESFLNEKRFEKSLAKIEARLVDLDIKGRSTRLSFLSNLQEIIRDATRQGITTIVAVGDDSTLSKVVAAAAEQEVAVGYIPMFENSEFARILGIPPAEHACDALAQRITEKIDLGKINGTYFLSKAQILQGHIAIQTPEGYTIEPTEVQQEISVFNLAFNTLGAQRSVYSPTDGFLEAAFAPIERTVKRVFQKPIFQRPSVFQLRKLKIEGAPDEVSIKIDNQGVVKTPATIEVVPQKLKIIVGKERMF